MGRDQRRLAANAGTACPKCGTTLPADAILCVNCGFHRVHARVLKTRDAAADARDAPRDPTRIWLFAAPGSAVLGAVLRGAVIWWASRPPSIIGKWTGHAAFDFQGLPVITDGFHDRSAFRAFFFGPFPDFFNRARSLADFRRRAAKGVL